MTENSRVRDVVLIINEGFGNNYTGVLRQTYQDGMTAVLR